MLTGQIENNMAVYDLLKPKKENTQKIKFSKLPRIKKINISKIKYPKVKIGKINLTK